MPDSKQLAILKWITNHLETMTVDDGFGYDMAGRVFRGRALLGDEMPLPSVSVLEAPRPDESPRPYGHEDARRLEDWILLVQGWVEDDKVNPTDPAYDLKAHVEARLAQCVAINESGLRVGKPTFPEYYRLGGLAAGVAIGPGVVSPPRQNVSAKAFFYLPVVVKGAFSPLAPFAS